MTWAALSAGGILAALLFSVLVHPNYPDLCQTVMSASQACDPVPFSGFLGYTLLFTGMVVWIIGPVVWALLGIRRGYKWEQSRTEPAEINLIILIGFSYMGLGVLVQVVW